MSTADPFSIKALQRDPDRLRFPVTAGGPRQPSASPGTDGSVTEPRVRFATFGCRVNQYETSMMRRLLARELTDVASGSVIEAAADVVVLNACTVTALAERKARQTARRIRREKPKTVIVLVGCLADAVSRGLTRFDDADLLAGNRWKTRIVDVVTDALSGRRGVLPDAELGPLDAEKSLGETGRVRAWLKVQDGCDNACTYCRPTQVRGPARSKRIDVAVLEARRLVDSGCREVVLTGINLARYSRGGQNLPDLIRSLLTIPGLLRLRLASINPEGVTPELLAAVAADRRACAHFHVPLQSGDDGILHRMQRGYTAAQYVETIEAIRYRIPHATVGTDVIVGFPGEDGDAFESTCSVAERLRFSNLHVFRYSERAGTAAATFDRKVPAKVAQDRARKLADLGRRMRATLLDKRVSSTQDVLVEEQRDKRWRGYTQDYLPVTFSSNTAVAVGTVYGVRILGHAEGGMEGVIEHRTDAD